MSLTSRSFFLLAMFLLSLVFSCRSQSQKSIVVKNGVKYTTQIDVSFNRDVVNLGQADTMAFVDAIRSEYRDLQNYLSSFGPVILRKSFPGSIWGDTIRVNTQGRRAKIGHFARYYTILFPEPVPLKQTLLELNKFPEIRKASSPGYWSNENNPNDPKYLLPSPPGEQWYLRKIRLDQAIGAWEITTGSKNWISGAPLSVALIEPGGVGSHNDLPASKKRGGETLLASGGSHGLGVAAIAAASTNTTVATGMASVGWGIYFTPFDGSNGTEPPADIHSAADLDYVRVINCSFTLICEDDDIQECAPCYQGNDYDALEDAIYYAANEKGKLIIAAGGNPDYSHSCSHAGNNPYFPPPYDLYPASFSVDVVNLGHKVLAVSPTTSADAFATGGYNFGPHISIASPGIDILTATGASSFGLGSGTSYAAPIVSAVAGLMFDINPNLSAEEAGLILQATPEQIGPDPYPGGRNDYFGHGRVDAYRAVREAIPIGNRISATAIAEPRSIWSSAVAYVNTAFLVMNTNRVSYPQSHVELGTNQTLQNSTLVVEKKTWVYTGVWDIFPELGSRVVIEPESEIFMQPGGVVRLAADSWVSFQGAGSCLGLRGGTLKLDDNAIIKVNNGGVIANFDPSVIELGVNSRIIIEPDGKLVWNANSSWSFGSGAKVEIYGTLKIADGITMTLPAGSDIRFNPGSKLQMGWGASIVSNGKFSAIGTLSNPIEITSNRTAPLTSEYWSTLDLKNGPDTLKHCVVKYSQNGIWFNGNSSTLLVDSCTITKGSGYAVQAYNTSLTANSLKIRDCKIDSNSYGVTAQNGRIDIVQTSSTYGIRANQYGINVWTGGKVYMNNTYVTDNTEWGVYVNGTTAYASFTPDGITPGYNRVRDNEDGEIWIVAGSAFLGNIISACQCIIDPPEDGPHIGGDPKIIDVNCPTGCSWVTTNYAGHNYISGPTLSGSKYWIKNNTTATTLAKLNYWGPPPNQICPPPDSSFSGPVDRSNCLTNGGYAPFAGGKELDGSIPPSPFVDLPTARHIIRHLKQLLLANNGDVRDALHWLSTFVGPGGYYQDELGVPWETFLQTLSSIGPQRFKTLAKAYRVQAKMDNKNFDGAITLANTLLSGNPDDEMWFHCQESIINALIAKGQLSEARSVYNAMSSRGSTINPDATDHLLYVLDMQSPTQISGGMKLSNVSRVLTNTIPTKSSLAQNFPNPFNPATTIKFEIVGDVHVSLKIFDMIGREVYNLVDDNKKAGSYEVPVDGTKLASGVYIYRLSAGNFTDSRKMVLLK